MTASASDTRPDSGDVAPAGERDPGFPDVDVNASPAQPAQPAKVEASTSPPAAAEGASPQQAGAGAANSPYAGYQNSNTVGGNRDTGEDSPNNVHGAANLPGEDGSAESPAKLLHTEQSEEHTVSPTARSIARPGSGTQTSIANEGVSAMTIVPSPSGGSPSHFDGTDPKQQSQPNALDPNLSALETSQAGLPDLLEPTDGRVVQSTIALDSKAVGGGPGGIEVLSSNSFTRDGPEQLAPADDPLSGEASGGGGVVIETLAIAPGAQISSLGYIISAGSDLNPLVLSTDASMRLEDASEPTVLEISGGGVAFGTMTLPPGAQFTSMGHIVSAASGVVIIDGTRTLSPGVPLLLTMADDPDIHEASGGSVVVGTMTLPPGAQVKILGDFVSAASNHFDVDDTPYTIGASQEVSIPLIQGSNPSLYEATDGGVVLKSTTLLPGAQITYSSHTLSVGSGIVAIDETPHLLSTTPRTSIPLLHEASDGGLVLGSTTLPPGVQTTHCSHVISVGSSTAFWMTTLISGALALP